MGGQRLNINSLPGGSPFPTSTSAPGAGVLVAVVVSVVDALVRVPSVSEVLGPTASGVGVPTTVGAVVGVSVPS